MRNASTKPACGRARWTTTSGRIASARTCTSRSPPRVSGARRSITCCSTARPAWARPRSRTSSRTSCRCRSQHRRPGPRKARRPRRHPHQAARRAKSCSSTRSTACRRRSRRSSIPRSKTTSSISMIGQGPSARSVKVPLQPFTLVGATTRTGLLTAPLRSRFGLIHRLDFYNDADMQEIVSRSGRILDVPLDAESAGEIARRSRGTPRIANRLLRRVRDYAQVRADGKVTHGDRARGDAHARRRRQRLRRKRSPPAAHDHRQVRRRTGGPQHDRRGDQRGARRHRRHLRAVSHADRLSRSHAARPRGDGACVSIFRARPPLERTHDCGDRLGHSHATAGRVHGRPHLENGQGRLAPDLRAAARADQRRPRKDGRHQRRVDPAAHRHPRASSRRARRRHVRSREGSRAKRRWSRPASRRWTST